MENKYNKSGKLSKRKMKLINYEDKISKMSKEDFLKELEQISKTNYSPTTYFANAGVNLGLAISFLSDQDLSNLIFASILGTVGVINLMIMIRENYNKKLKSEKLDILLKYVDSEEVKENEKDSQKI